MALLDTYALLILLPYMATLGTLSFRTGFFRCPRCRELFAKRSLLWSTPDEMFVRRCVHCGIRAGTPRSAVVTADPDSPNATP
jgi:hypothetical protein